MRQATGRLHNWQAAYFNLAITVADEKIWSAEDRQIERTKRCGVGARIGLKDRNRLGSHGGVVELGDPAIQRRNVPAHANINQQTCADIEAGTGRNSLGHRLAFHHLMQLLDLLHGLRRSHLGLVEQEGMGIRVLLRLDVLRLDDLDCEFIRATGIHRNAVWVRAFDGCVDWAASEINVHAAAGRSRLAAALSLRRHGLSRGTIALGHRQSGGAIQSGDADV